MEIKEKVTAILCDKLGLEEYEVDENKQLVSDLGADSLDIVEIIMEIEKEFDVKIDDNELSEIKTVGDIEKKLISLGITE